MFVTESGSGSSGLHLTIAMVCVLVGFGLLTFISGLNSEGKAPPSDPVLHHQTQGPLRAAAIAGGKPRVDPFYAPGPATRLFQGSTQMSAEWLSARPPFMPTSVSEAAIEITARDFTAPMLAGLTPQSSMPEPGIAEAESEPPSIPVPMARPPDLEGLTPQGASPAQGRVRAANAPSLRRSRLAEAPADLPDTRNLFERLLGLPRETEPKKGPALAYASPRMDTLDPDRSDRMLPPSGPSSSGLPSIFSPRGPSPAGEGIAIYDITAKLVVLPNGERLEAHSGLGQHRDDPRAVHLRMRGPTPPHVYDLSMREAPFHGVQAIRLNPVGGSRAIKGRAGLLAHTYLLGPNGDSNGCISFRDYERFLKAFRDGEVKRLIVVARSS